MAEFVVDVRIAANGRMVLPQAVRKAMGVTGEGRLILSVEGNEVRLSPISHVVSRVQELYRSKATLDADAVSFLEERRSDDRDFGPVEG